MLFFFPMINWMASGCYIMQEGNLKSVIGPTREKYALIFATRRRSQAPKQSAMFALFGSNCRFGNGGRFSRHAQQVELTVIVPPLYARHVHGQRHRISLGRRGTWSDETVNGAWAVGSVCFGLWLRRAVSCEISAPKALHGQLDDSDSIPWRLAASSRELRQLRWKIEKKDFKAARPMPQK